MLTDITLGQYYPGSSVIHGLDPRAKILATLLFIAAIFFAESMLSYGVLAAFLRSFGFVRCSGYSAFAPACINGAAQRKASVDYYFAYAVYSCFYG